MTSNGPRPVTPPVLVEGSSAVFPGTGLQLRTWLTSPPWATFMTLG